jgi:serine/threonine protein kinase
LPPQVRDVDTRLVDFLAPAQEPEELGRLGKYRILKVLGHGGMGVVYKAEDPVLRRAVPLKAMLPTLAASASAGKRFLREAQAMAALEHDHIVRVYQVDEERGVPFLAMEFLKGEPLDVRLERDPKLSVLETVRIGKEIAEGLAAAHATGLIHRDIKPANVWLEARRPVSSNAARTSTTHHSLLTTHQAPTCVKILDFGLARSMDQESGLTQQGGDRRHAGVHGA